jgi:hypothetical protein
MQLQDLFGTTDERVGHGTGNRTPRLPSLGMRSGTTRGSRIAVLAAATLIGGLSACASDSDGAETSASSPTAATTPAPVETDLAPVETDLAPVETDLAPAETEPAPVETEPAPVETDPPPPPTVAEPAPKRLLAGTMSGGTTFVAAFMEPQVTFTIPEAHGPQSWNAIRLGPEGFVILALQDAPPPGVPADYEPGAGVSLVSEGATVDDVVASVTAYAAENDDFDVTVESAQFRGEEVTVLRASSSRVGGFVDVPTSSDSGFGFPDGPRRFVGYLIDGPSQVAIAHFDSHELDYDFMVERATPVLESIEFQ